MYSYEDKMRAIELYLRYDRSAAAAINELGYPNRHTLRPWHMELAKNGDLSRGRHRRYDDFQKRAAVDRFFDHGQCLARIVRQLGYPKSKELLASWVDELEPGRRRRRAKADSFTDDQKREAVIALASRKASAQEAADAVGVTRAVLCKWKNQLLGEGAPCKMEAVPKDTVDDVDALRSQAAELQEQIKRLELRKAILEGAVELLGKGRGVDPGMLTNREKALIANSLRPARRLNEILSELGMSRSSCQYQVEAMRRPGKHAGPRRRISEVFAAGDGRYGYRRIRLDPRSEGVRVSEKVVARLMRELDLVAERGKKRKCSSCKGEISGAPENLVKRNFHADAPNALRFTGITEFRIPAGKVYLSPVVDRFDGMVVSWAMSTSPNAELANAVLDAAAATLSDGEHPVGHADRGCHYRWPGWIERCEKYGIARSMSKKGCSPDNSACEGFFGRLKVELFYGRCWSGWSVDDFMDAVDRYIHWYNERRIKESLGGMSPLQYKRSLNLAA